MKKLFALIVLIMMVGCGMHNSTYYYIHTPDVAVTPKKSVLIYVDKDFGFADRVEIRAAVDQWNFAMNGQVKLDIASWEFMMEPSLLADKDKWFILKIDSQSKLKPADTKDSFSLAFCEKVGGHLMYIIRDRIGNADVKGITMHELGHLLGAQHVGNYLMYYHFVRAKYNCIDYASAEAVARAQDLDMGSMNYCIYESGN